MQRYYFNHRSSQGNTIDDVGLELGSDYDAGQAALAGVRSILTEAINAGDIIDLSGSFEVVDEHGNALISVAYADVLLVA